jgi:homoserine kinase type II
MEVFVLQHVHTFDDGEEDVKMIGVYSSRGQAEAAVERLSTRPGFSDTPEGFEIDPYVLDKDHWTEGYVTVTGRE